MRFMQFLVFALAFAGASVPALSVNTARRTFGGAAARWTYEFLLGKSGLEEPTRNGSENALRVSAARVQCDRFRVPGEAIPAYRCTFWMRDASGESGEYVAGGLQNGGGDVLHEILAALTGSRDHTAVNQLQCLKFESGEFRCGIL